MNPLDDRLKHHVTGAIERGKGVAIAGIPSPASEIFNFIGQTCIVKRVGWPTVYGTLEHNGKFFSISSPAGTHSFSFSADDVAALNNARIATLKPISTE